MTTPRLSKAWAVCPRVHPLLTVATLALLAISSNLHAAPAAEVIALRGTGEMIVDTQSTALRVGLRLQQGAEIHTHSPGRAKLRFPDGSVVVVSDASRLTLEALTEAPSSGTASSAFIDQVFTQPRTQLKRIQLLLEIGLIGQTVTPDPSKTWTVKGRSAVTAVRGTQFEVEVAEDQTYDVHISAGSVAVTAVSPADGHSAESKQPTYVLDQPGLGISCRINAGCEAPKAWGEERMRKLFERLSGI